MNERKNSLETASIGSLINAVYNIVDQIFIGHSIGSQGNAATNMVFPFVTIMAVLTMLIGVGGASNFSLRLGEGNKEDASKFVGNSLNQLAVTIVQITLNNVLGHYGELSVYGRDIPLAVVGVGSKANIVILSVIAGVSQSCQPIIGYNYRAKNYPRMKRTYKTAAATVTVIGAVAFVIYQVFPRQLISIFGDGSDLYFEFGIKNIKIFLSGCGNIGDSLRINNA